MKITLDWFIGFLEGEGSFTSSRDGGGHRIPSLQIAQNNRKIIEDIRKFLGSGNVYYNKHTYTWYIQIRAHEESKKLMKLIDGKLRTEHKQKQYDKWKRLVLNRKLKNKRWTQEEDKKLIKLINDSLSYDEIATILKRTPLAIRNRNWTKWHIPYKRDLRKKKNK